MIESDIYEAPSVEVIEVEVEQGFANSLDGIEDPYGTGDDLPWG